MGANNDFDDKTTHFYSHFKIRRAKKIWDTREKSSLFPYKRTAFFSGTPNFFGPYFEAALEL